MTQTQPIFSQLTVSGLVAPDYVLKVVRTGKGAGAIYHRHLNVKEEK